MRNLLVYQVRVRIFTLDKKEIIEQYINEKIQIHNVLRFWIKDLVLKSLFVVVLVQCDDYRTPLMTQKWYGVHDLFALYIKSLPDQGVQTTCPFDRMSLAM